MAFDYQKQIDSGYDMDVIVKIAKKFKCDFVATHLICNIKGCMDSTSYMVNINANGKKVPLFLCLTHYLVFKTEADQK